MICTSSYSDWKSNMYKTYSISFDHGKDANYRGEYYSDLEPKLTFWRTWRNNIGKVSDEENNRYYVEEYWKQVLSKLDPEKVYNDLDDSILLCYEDNDKFCHRHIVAAWFEILLDETVSEMKANGYHTEKVSRPEYIKQYLDDAMRLNSNMKGFNSLRALYLFEKGNKLDALADELEAKTGKHYDNYRQAACYLRCDADMEEDRYLSLEKQKKLTKKK